MKSIWFYLHGHVGRTSPVFTVLIVENGSVANKWFLMLLPWKNHVWTVSDLCSPIFGIHISRGYTYHCDTGVLYIRSTDTSKIWRLKKVLRGKPTRGGSQRCRKATRWSHTIGHCNHNINNFKKDKCYIVLITWKQERKYSESVAVPRGFFALTCILTFTPLHETNT